MSRVLAVLAVMSAVVAPQAVAVPPVVGGQGLCPNATALAAHIRDTYPAVLSIGGVRRDPLPDHPSGHAIDIIVGNNTQLGNTIAADIHTHTTQFGVRYMLWQAPQHYDHIHVSVN